MRDILLAPLLTTPAVHPESRAFQMAEEHGSLVHVVSVRERPDARAPTAHQIAEDLAARRGVARLGQVVVREGEPWRAILEEAADHSCELIVVGPSSGSADLKEALFGGTAEHLAHRATQPVLNVRRPAERPYHHVLAATDFSEGSRHALLTVARLLPRARLTLLHAYRVPFEGFLRDPANEQDFQQTSRQARDAFLQWDGWPAGVLERLSPILVLGAPYEAILDHDAEDPVDLVVLGSHGQTGPFEKLLGGTAEQLLKMLPMDVMLVREPSPTERC